MALTGDRPPARLSGVTRPSEQQREALIAAARAAREYAHCPYSRFAVGAALLTAMPA